MASNQSRIISFHTADSLESKTVTTGSEHLDKLLGGGLVEPDPRSIPGMTSHCGGKL